MGERFVHARTATSAYGLVTEEVKPTQFIDRLINLWYKY